MNTAELLASIKRGVAIPANQNRYTDVDILAMANEETQTKLLPVLMSLRQEYLVRKDTVAIVAGQFAYPIPYRAVGRTLRDVLFITGNTLASLPYIQPEDAQYYSNNAYSTGTPTGFYFEGDNVIVIPTPNSTVGSLVLKYALRCSALTDISTAGQITAINTTGNYVTVASMPSILTIGANADFIQGKSGNTIIAMDQTITNISSTNIYFTSLPSTLAIGDWVSLAETSPVVQLPQEMHQVLAQAVECRLLEGLGDFEGLQASSAKLAEKTVAMLSLLTPRIQGEQIKIIQRNGLLNRGTSLRRRGF